MFSRTHETALDMLPQTRGWQSMLKMYYQSSQTTMFLGIYGFAYPMAQKWQCLCR